MRWGPGRGRSVLLSPFDSLLWYRERVERLFGLRHRLEAYTPKEKRVYGYFAMPVLAGTKIVGLVDPGRQGDVLVAKLVTLLRPTAVGDVARALVEAASWVDCTAVDIARWSRRRRGPRWRATSAGLLGARDPTVLDGEIATATSPWGSG